MASITHPPREGAQSEEDEALATRNRAQLNGEWQLEFLFKKMQHFAIVRICWNYNYGGEIYYSHRTQKGSNYQHCKIKMQTVAFHSPRKLYQVLDWFIWSFIHSCSLVFPTMKLGHQALWWENLSHWHTVVTCHKLPPRHLLKVLTGSFLITGAHIEKAGC